MPEDRWRRLNDVFAAACAQPPGARAALLAEACGDDLEMRREVESLLASHDAAGGFLSGPALGPAAPPDFEGRRIGPYRLLAVAGEGGMGLVYRAIRDDDTFRKTVALKLVRGGATPEHQRRLATERQILARLQHPNIATLLDGGTSDEGQPYLAMEYVEGEPIDDYCNRRGLAVAGRLALFRSVCAAVHYAHQNLVVHRDLKPSNILVTPEGQVKLLDFGIAKLLAADVDLDEAPTATLLPLLTPAFASPEQLRGQAVTTASDVYSLGVVLYELLTGALPHAVGGHSFAEALHAVCETEPLPPSAAARAPMRTTTPRVSPAELRGDLDTIVMRALRKEPERRYASAHELAEDIRRHLEGLPVLARADTVRYRAGKFVRRHRFGVAATALVTLTLLGGIVATARQGRIAVAERARAERRFADVRKLANSFVFEFHDAIRDLPGSTPARQLVVKKGLEYLDSLAQEAGADPVLQLELARAYEKVGDVQGSPLGANMGDPAGAITSYRKEVAIREALQAARPGDRESARALASAYRRLGLLEDETGQTQAGVANVRRAQQLAERLVAEDAADHRTRRILASAHDATGLLALKTGDQAAAERHQREAVAIWEAEVQAAPEDGDALRGLHLTHGALGRTLRITGRIPESADHYQRARAVAERRLRLAPNDPVARRAQSTGNGNLAVALYKQGDHERATRHMATSLALDEEVLRSDPKNSQAQRDVGWDLSFLAELASVRGKLNDALEYQKRALAVDQARADASPDSFQAQKDLAENLSGLSDLLSRMGRFDAAVEASRRSLAQFEKLQKANPGQTRLRQLMAAQYARQGSMLDALSARADACQSYRRSHDLWKELTTGGAAIDDEHAARRKDVEKAITRCAR